MIARGLIGINATELITLFFFSSPEHLRRVISKNFHISRGRAFKAREVGKKLRKIEVESISINLLEFRTDS